MSIRPILLWGEPCLRAVAESVGSIDDTVLALVADLTDTMYAAPGRGLAAPQIGVSRRVLVIDAFWKDGADRAPVAMIDPAILARSDDTAERQEGCLSIPDVPVLVTRPATVAMQWTGLDGSLTARRLDGAEAVCAMHELDHLDGVMIPDHATPEARADVAARLALLNGGSWTP